MMDSHARPHVLKVCPQGANWPSASKRRPDTPLAKYLIEMLLIHTGSSVDCVELQPGFSGLGRQNKDSALWLNAVHPLPSHTVYIFFFILSVTNHEKSQCEKKCIQYYLHKKIRELFFQEQIFQGLSTCSLRRFEA